MIRSTLGASKRVQDEGAEMKQTQITKTLEFKAQFPGDGSRIWEVLAALGGVDRWLSVISSCRVEGNGAGARRYCETADGGQLEERIISIDPGRRTLRYSIERGLPVDRYEGEFRVDQLSPGRTEVAWKVWFEGPVESAEQVEAMVTAVCPAGLRSLAEYAARGGA